MKYFVMEYDEREGKMLAFDEEPNMTAALANRRAREGRRGGRDVSIVLFLASSKEGLRQTHGRYFREPRRTPSKSLRKELDRVRRQTGKARQTVDALVSRTV